MTLIIKYVGYTILIVGAIVGLYLGGTMKIYTPGLTEGFLYDDPHPLRWAYGFGTILSSAFFGLVLVGLGKIIELIEELSNDQRKSLSEISKRA
ncbi:hypothetical protein DOE78_18755 [Bacillus sp. Y1]|nr:hypothetical protein [Bacillus sp. Y1]AYA77324.1 hypothetical protein DOE78_18755 [Bacillus sp. Y1]